VIINTNTDKTVVSKIRKEIKENNNACPYFLKIDGKLVSCFCQDIINAPENTYCHTKLYKKESENNI